MDAQSPRRLNILVLLPFLAKAALSLYVMRAMRERGHRVVVAYYLHGGGGYTEDPCADFAAEGRLVDLSTRRGDEGIKNLDELVRERSIDLVLQIGSPAAYAQLPYLKEMHPRLPIVDTLYIRAAHVLSYCLFEACFDGVIVESRDMRDYLLSVSAKPDPCVRIVENGVDLNRFAPSTREGRNHVVVGFIGRMAPEKNPLAFVELAEQLQAKLPGASWRMYGEGPMDGAVRERVAAANRAGVAISFEGHLSQPGIGYAQMDVLIVPSSKVEGRPNVVMEANASGVPVIGAPAGAIPELIEEGRNGFVLAPGEFGRIGDLLAGWISDPASLDRLRKTSREIAEARFDAVRMFDAYEATFQAFASHSA